VWRRRSYTAAAHFHFIWITFLFACCNALYLDDGNEHKLRPNLVPESVCLWMKKCTNLFRGYAGNNKRHRRLVQKKKRAAMMRAKYVEDNLKKNL
jgi:hypothetical protein